MEVSADYLLAISCFQRCLCLIDGRCRASELANSRGTGWRYDLRLWCGAAGPEDEMLALYDLLTTNRYEAGECEGCVVGRSAVREMSLREGGSRWSGLTYC